MRKLIIASLVCAAGVLPEIGCVQVPDEGQKPKLATHVSDWRGEVIYQVLTDRFATKESVDPVRVRLNLKEADEALDHFDGELGSGEHLELIAKELWAAALLELYGDPPPPTMRGYYEATRPENYLETAADKPGDGDDAHA